MIPVEWKKIVLGEYLEVIRGASPRPKGDPRYFGGSIPWITIKDVNAEKGKYLTKTAEGVTQAGAEKSRLIPVGGLILSNSASVCIPKILKKQGCIHDGFVTFPDLENNFSVDYFYHLFNWMRPEVIQDNKQGVTQVNLNLDIVKAFKIPIPPYEEQKEISFKLDKLLQQVEIIQKSLDNASTILKHFRQSVLTAGLCGKLTEEWREVSHIDVVEFLSELKIKRENLLNKKIAKDFEQIENEIGTDFPDSWSVMPLGKISTYITSGSRGWSKFYSKNNKGAYFVRSAEINNNILRLDEAIHVTLPKKVEGKRSLIEKGDLLITITGANVGKCAVVTETIPEAYVSQSVSLIKALDSRISKYLHLWLLSESSGGKQIIDMAYGMGRPVLSLPQIYSVKVPLPPIEEQNVIIKRIEKLFSFADQIEKRIIDTQKRVNNLTQSILAKAFRGELTAEWREQNPDLISGENSAEALLEKIKAERVAKQISKSKKKKKTNKKTAA